MKEVSVFDIKTAKAAAIKAESVKVIEAYNSNAQALVAHFIALCDRFTEIDKQSGNVLANFLDALKNNPRIRNGVIEKLNQFSENNLSITQAEDGTWKVQTVKAKGKSALNVTKWKQKIAAYEEKGALSLLAGKSEKKEPKAPSAAIIVKQLETVLGRVADRVESEPESIGSMIEEVEKFLAALKKRASHQEQSEGEVIEGEVVQEQPQSDKPETAEQSERATPAALTQVHRIAGYAYLSNVA